MNRSTNSIARRGAGLLATAAVALGVALALPQSATATPAPPSVPQDIAVPAGNVLSGMGNAEGFQIYICGTGGWTLQQPMAVLTQGGHKPFALHYGGPTWMAMDGSAVVAARAGSVRVPGQQAMFCSAAFRRAICSALVTY